MWYLLCLLGAALAAPPMLAPEKTRYDGYEVLAVKPTNMVQFKYLIKLSDDIELDFWKEAPIGEETHIMVPPHKQDQLRKQLTKRRIPFSVHISNVQQLVDEEAMRLSTKKRAFDYDEYNTLEDIMTEIGRLANNCPDNCTCSTRDIGESVEGRPITLLDLNCDAAKPTIWIDSAIHAREWLAPATVFKFIRRIWGEDDVRRDDDGLRENYNFVFVPMMNPDGYLYSWNNTRMWRKNRGINPGSSCIGTDLNRNYATNWGISGTSANPCADNYHGASNGSEPETQAVQDESRRLNLTAFVSVHTYGNYWLHPWGHSVGGSCVIADDHADMYAAADAAADAAAAAEPDNNNWLRGNSCQTIYPASGLTIEYAKDPGGTKYTFTPELRGGSFAPPPSAIGPSDREFYAAISAQMAVINPDIED